MISRVKLWQKRVTKKWRTRTGPVSSPFRVLNLTLAWLDFLMSASLRDVTSLRNAGWLRTAWGGSDSPLELKQVENDSHLLYYNLHVLCFVDYIQPLRYMSSQRKKKAAHGAVPW